MTTSGVAQLSFFLRQGGVLWSRVLLANGLHLDDSTFPSNFPLSTPGPTANRECNRLRVVSQSLTKKARRTMPHSFGLPSQRGAGQGGGRLLRRARPLFAG
jgi:hypothetical protein